MMTRSRLVSLLVVLGTVTLGAPAVAGASPSSPSPAAPLSSDVREVTVRESAMVSTADGHAPATAAPSGVPPQSVRRWFPTASLSEMGAKLGTGIIPPDSMGAVGPDHFIEVINGSVSIYAKGDGAQLSYVSLESFFTVTEGPTTYPRGGAFDPRVLYDRLTGRFFATAMEMNGRDDNGVILAVSRTSDATGLWDRYFLDVGAPGLFTDYSTLGVDDNGVYVGMAMFAPSTFDSYRLAVTPKATLIAGSPALGPLTLQTGIIDMWGSPQPASRYDSSPPGDVMFFISSRVSATPGVSYRHVTWSSGIPTISTTTEFLDSPAYGVVKNAPAKDSTIDISTGDFRMQMAVRRGDSVWTARTVGVNGSGGASPVDRDAAEFLELTASGTTLSLQQSGRVFDDALTDPRSYFFPSLAVTGQGHVVMGYSGVRASEYVGMYASWRVAGDPPNTMRPPVLLQAGLAAYDVTYGGSRNRWGDYSYTTVDPDDDMSVYTIQEYARAGGHDWGTGVAEIAAPPPPASPAADPSTVATAASVAVEVTGSTTDGSGFFDPGAGFVDRLTASATGGVVVNGITYVAPGQVDLDLDTSSATPGTQTVTITNPDGQTTTVDVEVIADPTLTIADISVGEGTGGTTVATLTITASAPVADGTTVDWATSNGTATSPADYAGDSGTAAFVTGEETVEIEVDVVADSVDEIDEDFVVTLSNPVNAVLAPDDDAAVTIADDDTSLVSVADVTLGEDDGPADVEVSLSVLNSRAVDVTFTTVDGSAVAGDDYTAVNSSVVTIPAGSSSVTVPVQVADNAVVDGTRAFTVELTNPVNAVLGVDTATVTITDDEVSTLSVGDVTLAEDEGPATVTVSMATLNEDDVEVDVSTVDGTALDGDDYSVVDDTVTIPAGESSVTVDVPVADNAVVDGTRSFSVVLSDPVNAVLGDDTATVTITDDDVSTLSVADVTVAEDEGPATITVTMATLNEADVEVDVSTVDGTAADGDDFTAVDTTVTIPAGESSVTVDVPVADNTAIDGDRSFTVVLSDPVNAVLGDDTATVTITDDDVAPTGPPVVERVAGGDRIATAVEISKVSFPGGTPIVVVANAFAYPDAMAGGPLAFAVDAPILTTGSAALHPAVGSEVDRLGATTAYLLGGELALAPQVEADLRARGVTTIIRLGGGDRFATAALIAAELVKVRGGATGPVYVVEGANPNPQRGWPDLLSVGPLAAFQGRPVLLVRTDDVPSSTADAIASLGVSRATIVGGTSAVSDTTATRLGGLGVVTDRLSGPTRYATSRAVAEVAETVGMDPVSTWLATGLNFADALVGGPAVARDGGVMLLIHGQDPAGSPEIFDWLEAHDDSIRRVRLLGGEVALTKVVEDAVRLAIGAV